MAEVRFEAVLSAEGNGTFIPVPADVPSLLRRMRAPVLVTVNGHAYRSTVMRYGERYVLPLNRANREAAGVAAGDAVVVELAPDEAARAVDVPADLAAALDAAPGARAAFDALGLSHRREWVESVTEARRPETRARRIARAVAALRERAGDG
jgi:hypothetical protein